MKKFNFKIYVLSKDQLIFSLFKKQIKVRFKSFIIVWYVLLSEKSDVEMDKMEN